MLLVKLIRLIVKLERLLIKLEILITSLKRFRRLTRDLIIRRNIYR